MNIRQNATGNDVGRVRGGVSMTTATDSHARSQRISITPEAKEARPSEKYLLHASLDAAMVKRRQVDALLRSGDSIRHLIALNPGVSEHDLVQRLAKQRKDLDARSGTLQKQFPPRIARPTTGDGIRPQFDRDSFERIRNWITYERWLESHLHVGKVVLPAQTTRAGVAAISSTTDIESSVPEYASTVSSRAFSDVEPSNDWAGFYFASCFIDTTAGLMADVWAKARIWTFQFPAVTEDTDFYVSYHGNVTASPYIHADAGEIDVRSRYLLCNAADGLDFSDLDLYEDADYWSDLETTELDSNEMFNHLVDYEHHISVHAGQRAVLYHATIVTMSAFDGTASFGQPGRAKAHGDAIVLAQNDGDAPGVYWHY